MLGVQKTTPLSSSLLHIDGLAGTEAFLAEGHTGSALLLALVATACVLLLAGAVVLAEIGRVKVRQYVLKHEERAQLPRAT